ncbi:MAG: hypothetical protein EOP42_02230 [Sphingobacteriaceae bacterium]|nr:MAG: hypothetical protein EOP42_02230 [Sphingobacteriaceae bacterium]
MKTSNKLFITAVSIIIISMIGYDLALRAEYRKGEYKNRFYGKEKISALSGFTAIDNRTANFVSVDIEHGKNSVIWTTRNWKDNFKIYKNGSTLVIEAIYNEAKHIKPYNNDITIICPAIEKIVAKPFIVKSADYYEATGRTTLKGFDIQNLLLNIGKSADIILQNNNIEQLQAVIGEDHSGSSNLTISSDNQINTAKINVLGRNWLRIENPNIGQKQFTISDSATISVGGKFHNQLKN